MTVQYLPVMACNTLTGNGFFDGPDEKDSPVKENVDKESPYIAFKRSLMHLFGDLWSHFTRISISTKSSIDV